ncbi:putative calcium-binding outer membrane-like protein, partial [Vibrio splendidus 12B01]|uniref:Calx-beta domain-containing protein n=2 Tax=Vibrio splendidus TaxID=29497 RepID=UPI0000671CFF
MDMTTLNLGGALALGQRIVISVDGTIKVLEEGQPLQAGDVVLESQNGSNEPQVSAKRFSSEEGEIELDQDIANIFAALEEGQDPTELGEEFATAAGQNGSSLASSGTIERDGEETIPGTEFVTTGFEALGLSRTQSLSLLDAYRSLTEAATPLNSNPSFVDSNNAEASDVVTFTTDEDTPVSGTLSASDEDGDDLSFSKATEPSNGTVVVDENGDWTYTPNENYNGNDSFTVVVSDGQGGTDTITVNIGVTPVNDLPVGEDVSVTTDEDTPVSGSLTATDADNDQLTFSKGTEPSNGSVVVDENGNWTYTPDENYNGSDSFSVVVDDGQGGTDTITVDVGVSPVPSVSITETVNVSEGSAAEFTVSLDKAADTAVTVNLTSSTAGANTAESDDIGNMVVTLVDGVTVVTPNDDGSYTIPAGQTEVKVSVATTGDDVYEGDETFSVNVEGNLGSIGIATAAVTINDAQSAPVVSIAADQTNVDEGDTAGFTVSIDQEADEAVVVNFTYSGVAADGSDFTGVASVTIPAGSTTADLDITTINDGIYEGAESFTVSIDSVSGADATVDAANDSAAVTINDAQSAPVVSIAADQTNVDEGDTAGFTVSIDQEADEAVVVNFTYSGVAADGSDFTGVASVTIPAGSTTADLDITTINDGIYEGAESFTVSIDSVSGADATVDAANDSAAVTINDAQSAPVVSIAADQTNVDEGDTAGFTVSIDQEADEAVVVNFTYSGVAADGSDFTGVASVTIPAGSTTADLDITTINDGIYEGAESFTVSIDSVSGADATVDAANDSAAVTINDAQSAPVVSIAADQTNVDEGDTAGFTVSIDQEADEAVVVNFTYSGVAADGSDFTGVASVTIPAGSTTADLDITTINDGIYEGAESFTVSIDSVSGADATVDAANDSAAVTINDAQSAPVVSIAADQTNVDEGDTAGFTVSIDQEADEAVVVNFTYSGVAADGSDFTGVASVTIPAGSTTADLDITTINDGIYEGAESFTVSIDSVSGADATVDAANDSAAVTINDAQSAPVVSIAADQTNVDEGDTAGFTVSIDQEADEAVVVNFTYSGVAADGSDFTGVASVTIPAGSTTADLDITTINDGIYEGAESFTVSIDSVSGADATVDAANDSAAVTINDAQSAPVVSIAADQTNVDEGDTAGFTVSIDQEADEAVVVNFTYSGVAADGSDFTGVASVTIPAGSTTADLDITTINDGIYEGAESFTVSIDSVSGADATVDAANDSAAVTINDAQSAPVVSIAADQTNVDEGDTAGFTVSIDQEADEAVVVNFTYSGVAADGSDFTGVASVTIPAGSTTADLDITTINDGIYEGAESFTVSIDSVSGADATVDAANDSAAVTINDAQSAPVVSIAADQTNVDEGDTAGFTVSIDQEADEAVVVNFTYSGVAADGSDFTGVASVTIPAGSTTADLDITTINDGIYEGAESFTVSIDSVSGADATVDAANDSAAVTINDAQSAPVVSIAADQTNVDEGDTAGFTVSIDQEADEAVVVNFTYSGVAADGSDFTGVASVTIPAGSTTADLDITTINDGIYEGAESFTVSIDSVSGADATVDAANDSAAVTINDAQSAPVVSIAADQT